jgi:hypothetical protein
MEHLVRESLPTEHVRLARRDAGLPQWVTVRFLTSSMQMTHWKAPSGVLPLASCRRNVSGTSSASTKFITSNSTFVSGSSFFATPGCLRVIGSSSLPNKSSESSISTRETATAAEQGEGLTRRRFGAGCRAGLSCCPARSSGYGLDDGAAERVAIRVIRCAGILHFSCCRFSLTMTSSLNASALKAVSVGSLGRY